VKKIFGLLLISLILVSCSGPTGPSGKDICKKVDSLIFLGRCEEAKNVVREHYGKSDPLKFLRYVSYIDIYCEEGFGRVTNRDEIQRLHKYGGYSPLCEK